MTNRMKMGSALAAILMLVACGSSSNDDAGSHGDAAVRSDGSIDAGESGSRDGSLDATSDATADASERLDDGQIVGVLEAVNMGEIQEAHLAPSRASNPMVLTFASQMASDHDAAETSLENTATTAGITARSSSTQAMLMATVTMQVSSLTMQSGGAFDDAYLMAQVEDHQTVLMLIDDVLLPSVSSAAIRTRVQEARDMVQSHLSIARSLAADGGIPDAGVRPADASIDAP